MGIATEEHKAVANPLLYTIVEEAVNDFSQNLLLSSIDPSIQLVQIVHNSAGDGIEVLSIYDGQLIFLQKEDYDLKSIFFQINIPAGPYQPPAMVIVSAQRDAIITITNEHSLTLEPVREVSSLFLEQSHYHLQMSGPSTNCYLRAKQELCSECNLVRKPNGAAELVQNGKPARLTFKHLTSLLA